MNPIWLTFIGRVPSKKNNYRPKKGGRGFFKDTDLQTQIDRLAIQIPGECRDLMLVSPEIEFHFTYTKATWDRDNAITTLLDLLVEYGVLKNDNIASCNGTITIHPAEHGDQDSVVVILTPS